MDVHRTSSSSSSPKWIELWLLFSSMLHKSINELINHSWITSAFSFDFTLFFPHSPRPTLLHPTLLRCARARSRGSCGAARNSRRFPRGKRCTKRRTSDPSPSTFLSPPYPSANSHSVWRTPFSSSCVLHKLCMCAFSVIEMTALALWFKSRSSASLSTTLTRQTIPIHRPVYLMFLPSASWLLSCVCVCVRCVFSVKV